MTLIFIMTNYNNSDYSINYYKSLLTSDVKEFRFIVVDNDSTEEEQNKLRDFFSDEVYAHIIYKDQNLGYFPGLNVGLEYFGDDVKSKLNDYLLIVGNNDLLIPSDFFSKIQSKIEIFSKYPVVSPSIITLDGEYQNPHVISSISSLRAFVYDVYHSNYIIAKLITQLAHFTKKWTRRGDELEHETSQEIYQGYGAVYIFSDLYLENFTALPETSFLMYEEYFLAHQLNSKGYKVFYESSVEVTHCCKGATGLIPGKLKWHYSKLAHLKYKKLLKEYKG